ncbi:hypothetical protein H5410_040722 [Solanum commersonii]|uniref:Uncharacterized protein n=1 Tax=Solanum commersonii TaxID=4109 RepID=A0A9J5XSS9_SOLCO|nr:hypothetical protein H5410_040722 [Solanum commersonii]
MYKNIFYGKLSMISLEKISPFMTLNKSSILMKKIIIATSMMHLSKTKCYVCRMDPPWVTKDRGRGNNTRGRGRSSRESSYGSASNSPIIQRGRMSLINSKISQSEASSSSVHLEDIPESIPLYSQLHAYLEEPWKIFQCYLVNGLYFLGDSYKTQSYYETILISTGSVEFQRFLGYNTNENVYNFSKMIIKQIIYVEDWGMSTMKERQISLNKVSMNFT